jgi:phage terminase large subunit
MYSLTTATKRVTALSKRLRVVQGGTSASKTISILLYLIAKAQSDTAPTVTSVISESFPHLKRGAIRDFLSIMQEHRYFKDNLWNKSDYTYTFETGSRIEFFSADQPGKVRGPRRDRLFINEANNIPYETFDQLEVRTKEFVIIDFNPTGEYWLHDQILGRRTDYEHIILTYLDNEALDPAIVAAIEQRKGNRSWFRVYGQGLLGEVEGLIYKNWTQIDELPPEAKLMRRWLDYGYTNDPTAIGDIYKYNDAYILDEQLYQKGLLNNQIGHFILNLEQTPVAADSAEPKSNDELALMGITIIPARKGADSVNNGIQLVQQQKILVTKRSVNIWKERNNYVWMTDKDGKIINEPSPIWNHHMDGIRYGFETLLDFIPDHVRVKQAETFDMNFHRRALNSTQ